MVIYDLNLFEVWKPIPGYENYEVSSEGRVRSLERWENLKSGGCRFRKGRLLKLVDRGKGYKCVSIFNDEGHKLAAVHRLVSEAFIPNPNNLPCVNHKDENPSNNNISNLEWCDYQYNNSYGNHNKKIVEVQVKKGHYNPKYSTLLTGLSLKEVKKLYYEDNKEKQLEKQKIRYQNKKKIV